MKVYFEKFVDKIVVATCRYHKSYAELISRNVLNGHVEKLVITSPGIHKDANNSGSITFCMGNMEQAFLWCTPSTRIGVNFTR